MAKDYTWLDEVRDDAKFNYMRRLREQEELKAHEEAKAARQARGNGEVEEAVESDSDEVAELKKQLKLERAARTRAEKKMNAQPDENEDDDKEVANPDSDDSEKEGKK